MDTLPKIENSTPIKQKNENPKKKPKLTLLFWNTYVLSSVRCWMGHFQAASQDSKPD